MSWMKSETINRNSSTSSPRKSKAKIRVGWYLQPLTKAFWKVKSVEPDGFMYAFEFGVEERLIPIEDFESFSNGSVYAGKSLPKSAYLAHSKTGNTTYYKER